MRDIDKALNEFIESGSLATNQCPNYLRDAYFRAGYRSRDKELETTKKQLGLYKEEVDTLSRIFNDYEKQGLSSMTIEYLSVRMLILNDEIAKLSKEVSGE